MNKLETVTFSNASSETEVIKNYDIPLEYCAVCFIALGSQEKRIYLDNKAVHLDCGKKAKPK